MKFFSAVFKLCMVFLIAIGSFACSLPTLTWEVDAALDPLLRMANTDSVQLILETERNYQIRWRERRITDQRLQNRPQIRAEEELLWRWDNTPPNQIFRIGFQPRVDIEGLVFGIRNPATDLRAYVANNHASVFVSTTRRQWMPRGRRNTFRYDIFAPGGIDVNPTLGSHQYENQAEIAFFGGIRTEYIYGASEYDENERIIRYHLNTFYAGPQNPLNIHGRRGHCPGPVVNYSGLRRVRLHYCVSRWASNKKRSIGNELMRTFGSILPTGQVECSYWYKINVKYLAFDQPAESGQIEPFGEVTVYTFGKTGYTHSTVWKYSDWSTAPRVPKATALTSKAKCLVVQSDTKSGEVTVCFDGDVKESDSVGSHDIIANFRNQCMKTYPNSHPTRSYPMMFNGRDGSLKLAFTVLPCDDKCVKNHLTASYVNGEC